MSPTIRKAIYVAHWVLFFLFLATAIGAVSVFWFGDDLRTAGFIAASAAFFATASTFLERLFPGGQGDHAGERMAGD